MLRLSGSNIVLAVLIVGAIALGALGFAGFAEEVANSLLFAALVAALLALFMLALRLSLRGRGSRLSAWISTALVSIGAVAVAIAANVALFAMTCISMSAARAATHRQRNSRRSSTICRLRFR